jgi:hypothetical protein
MALDVTAYGRTSWHAFFHPTISTETTAWMMDAKAREEADRYRACLDMAVYAGQRLVCSALFCREIVKDLISVIERIRDFVGTFVGEA